MRYTDADGRAWSIEELVRSLPAPAEGAHRAIVGLVGAPGAGKSTLAARLAAASPQRCVVVGMDGFHLAQSELVRLGRADRKGAWDTFDAAGYVALLDRLRTDPGPVYAPTFDRDLEEPIAGAIRVAEQTVVITEGNYLLDEAGDWPAVARQLDQIWSVEIDDDLRRRWLVDRHVAHGRTPSAAEAWVAAVDEPNAARIVATRARTDRRLRGVT